MRTRKLGPLEVTVVGLGCNNFGGAVDEEGTRAVVDAALDAGVTFFDTADIYGNKGGSETLLGRCSRGAATRSCSRRSSAANGRRRRAPRLARLHPLAIDASLRAPADRHVDLYQHHERIPDTPLEETIGALEELVDEGEDPRVRDVELPAGERSSAPTAIAAGRCLRLRAERVLVA